MNGDETLISVSDEDLVECVVEGKSRNRARIAPPKIEQNTTFLLVVNVLGNTWLVAYLITGTTKMGEGRSDHHECEAATAQDEAIET